MTDPAAMDGMMSGMKTQMVMMVPQMLIMGWINFFFQGFVVGTLSLYVSAYSRNRFSSQTAFPSYPWIQIYASARNRNTGYGCQMGVFLVVVFPQFLRLERTVSAYTWKWKL